MFVKNSKCKIWLKNFKIYKVNNSSRSYLHWSYVFLIYVCVYISVCVCVDVYIDIFAHSNGCVILKDKMNLILLSLKNLVYNLYHILLF